MRLFVLGATGRTGKTLVAQGLARGHEITAFGRSAFNGKAKSLRVVVGNPMQANDLAAALGGSDIVLSALGTRVWAQRRFWPIACVRLSKLCATQVCAGL